MSCMKKIVILLSISCYLSSFASVDKQDISLFQIKKNDNKLQQILERFEVISKSSDSYDIYVPRFRSKQAQSLSPSMKLIKESIYTNPVYDTSIQSLARGYKSYDEVIAFMRKLQAKYPRLVSLNTYGKSLKGEDLFFLKISDNVEVDEDEPEVLITSATHGDELITTETLIRFLSDMMKENLTSERVAKIIQDHELYFIPVVNPDGFKRRRRYTSNGIDPNREYPYPELPNKNSVKCISDEISFFKSRDFVATLDLHAHGQMILYPWGYTKDKIPASDEEAFKVLGKKMAKENKYAVGQISRTIYVAPASSADYFYWQKGTLSYGVELARRKIPYHKKINTIVNKTKEMLYVFIENF